MVASGFLLRYQLQENDRNHALKINGLEASNNPTLQVPEGLHFDHSTGRQRHLVAICPDPRTSGRAVHARPPCPVTGASFGSNSAFQPRLEPVQHFALNPSDAVWAQLYPFGELACLLQPRDMLRRIQNKLLDLALRKNPHHDVSIVEEHRDAPGYDNT